MPVILGFDEAGVASVDCHLRAPNCLWRCWDRELDEERMHCRERLKLRAQLLAADETGIDIIDGFDENV